MTENKPFDEFAILEIMGHNRYAGRVSEQTIGGASFIRVDVPELGPKRPAFSKLFGAGSIYAITPVSEQVAFLTAQKLGQEPLTVWDLPQEIRDKIRQPVLTGPDDDRDGDEWDAAIDD